MEKEAIAILLEEKHSILFDWLDQQTDEKWTKGPEGKWTQAQHIQHLTDSLQLLNNALSYPKFYIKYKFGVCNREIKDYAAVTKNYYTKLKEKQELVKKFNKKVKAPTIHQKSRLLTRLLIQSKKLQYKTKLISDENLDTLVIPHPLMGKMTLREIIMWTACHTEHHTTILKDKYGEENYC